MSKFIVTVFDNEKAAYQGSRTLLKPQWSVADKGPGQPVWQVYFALNLQFR